MYKRIVVPLDGSDLAEQALPEAEALAVRLHGVPLHLVLAIDPTKCSTDEDDARAYLVQIQCTMAARGSTATIELVRGEMAAASLPGDLIVMATQERTGPARWQLGDAAEELLRHAQAPLLLIRAKPRG